MTTAERVAVKRKENHKLTYVQHGLCRLVESAVVAFILLLLCGWL